MTKMSQIGVHKQHGNHQKLGIISGAMEGEAVMYISHSFRSDFIDNALNAACI